MPTSTGLKWPSPGSSGALFANRVAAGRQLATRLEHLRDKPVVVLGLPRGGVPVAEQVAAALDAPLDVILVRKLGVPFQRELGMGAIGEHGVRVLNDDIVRRTRVSEGAIAAVEARERTELERRAARYRGDRPPLSLEGRVAVIVDDGIATGSTARAACQVARAAGAVRVVVAVPVAPSDWTARFQADADEFVCLHTPIPFLAVGQFYADFDAVDDDEVVAILHRARVADPRTPAWSPDLPAPREASVTVEAGRVLLAGHLSVPDRAQGIVLFAHGSGSSRHSPRNRYVAKVLNQAGLGTLLFDLLTPREEPDRARVFDIDLLARRLTEATRWLRNDPASGGLPIGYFGASTGAAAALRAAADPDADIAAVVSRGGRPDLAAGHLDAVRAPTLLIVGGDDDVVLDLNRQAQRRLRCENKLVVIPGAGHLFEQPGTLPAAATAARDWFLHHLRTGARRGGPA